MCAGQKLLWIIGIRKGLGEGILSKLKRGKEMRGKELEKGQEHRSEVGKNLVFPGPRWQADVPEVQEDLGAKAYSD